MLFIVWLIREPTVYYLLFIFYLQHQYPCLKKYQLYKDAQQILPSL